MMGNRINEGSISGIKNNVRFGASLRTYLCATTGREYIPVIAMRDIDPDEELFASYGDQVTWKYPDTDPNSAESDPENKDEADDNKPNADDDHDATAGKPDSATADESADEPDSTDLSMEISDSEPVHEEGDIDWDYEEPSEFSDSELPKLWDMQHKKVCSTFAADEISATTTTYSPETDTDSGPDSEPDSDSEQKEWVDSSTKEAYEYEAPPSPMPDSDLQLGPTNLSTSTLSKTLPEAKENADALEIKKQFQQEWKDAMEKSRSKRVSTNPNTKEMVAPETLYTDPRIFAHEWLQDLTETIKAAAENVIPKKKPKKMSSRGTSEKTRVLFKNREKMTKQNSSKEEFQNIQNDIKNACLDDFKSWVSECVEDIEHAEKQKDTAKIFKVVKRLTGKPKPPEVNLTTDHEGNLLSSPAETADRGLEKIPETEIRSNRQGRNESQLRRPVYTHPL